jgi:hypothetical protein
MNIFITAIKAPSAIFSKTRPYLDITSSNEFRLPGKYMLTVYGWIVTKSYQGTLEKNTVGGIDTAFTKTFFKNLSCTMRFNNLFKSVSPEEKFAINEVAASGRYADNSREFSVSLKYTLGNLKNSIYKIKDVDESGARVQ